MDILLLPHIRVQNGNALSSPFTVGFPAVTAWIGAAHALQRDLNRSGLQNVRFDGVGVVNHEFDLQTYRGANDYVDSIIGTANPLNEKGERPPFVEEARCHFDVTLAIECIGFDPDQDEALLSAVNDVLHSRLKIAGGEILSFSKPGLKRVNSNDDSQLTTFMRTLMPGYALIERRDLMLQAMENGEEAMEALIDHLVIRHRCCETPGGVEWSSDRREPGWIIPIATGFHGVSELAPPGATINQRDPTVPHRFAEAAVTLGEFVMPYRINSLERLLWRYRYIQEDSLYVCEQNFLAINKE
jgi:CRISPR-associated protein Csy2